MVGLPRVGPAEPRALDSGRAVRHHAGMNSTALGATGLPATPVGFGGAPFALLEVPDSASDPLLGALLDLGVGLVDTAACYKDSEVAIGRALGARRDQYTLVSKCGHQVGEETAEPWSAELIANSIDRSLQRLRTDRIDVMLLHSCALGILQRGEALEALRRARDAGKIRFLGYSGDNEAAAWAAEQPDVAVIEISISIADQRNIDGALAVALRRNLGVLAKRPIANAAWKEPERQPGFYRNYSTIYHERLARMGLSLHDLGYDGGGAPDQLWPELALRFTLSQPGVHSAIVGTTNPRHVAANIAAAEKGALSADQAAAIRAAFAAAEQADSEEWRAQG